MLDGEEMRIEVMPGKLRMLVAFHPSAAAHHAETAQSSLSSAQSLFEGLVGAGLLNIGNNTTPTRVKTASDTSPSDLQSPVFAAL